MAIEESINEASKILPIVWPLKSSIAINPLWDLTDNHYKAAINDIREHFPVSGFLSIDEYIQLYSQGKITNESLKNALAENNLFSNMHVTEFIKAHRNLNDQELHYVNSRKIPHEIIENLQLFISRYFDENQIKTCAGNTKFSLWEEWKQEAILNSDHSYEILRFLPSEPTHALQTILTQMQIKTENLTKLFEFLFSQLIGWHGFIKWMGTRKTNPLVKERASLIEIVLIWCCYLQIKQYKLNNEVLSVSYQSQNLNSQNDILFIWQRAYELTYQESIVRSLQNKSYRNKKPLAQFVFCIDVRSEPLRRHLEKTNSYETFGFAGFFGSIFALENSSNNTCVLQSPALVEPEITVKTHPSHSIFSRLSSLLNKVTKEGKSKSFGAFAFFEMVGYWMFYTLLKKTFFAKLLTTQAPKQCTYSNPFLAPENIEQTAKNMSSFLKTTGLSRHFSPTVIICGHQAKTTNNPFHASFECGACGGNSGFVNAKLTCEILNSKRIRELLITEGINIPSKTQFIAACHETTTDELYLQYDQASSTEYLKHIEQDIKQALIELTNARQAKLPGQNHYQDRAFHYAELIPEWSLANNAAMIIGPRRLSENANLDGRVFLHSYEPDLDPDAHILEGILTAPMIVAHWINAQYYFSSTDPEIYGAGNKAIHNVVSKIGVIEGNQNDLKIGLPLQSVFFRDKRVHEPLKLLVIIYAQYSQLNEVFKRQPQIKSLFENQWLNMHVINP
ncbi:MAG: putative inorganic carbon transporter subunit DabA [Candidatus Berkiella sp.]